LPDSDGDARFAAASRQIVASQAPTGSAQNQKKNGAANIKFPQILNFREQTPVRVCEWLT
jgi:hypothetical protein